MNTPPIKRIAYSVAEACGLIGISRSKLYQLIASGELGSKKIGRRRLIPAKDLDRLFAVNEDA